MHKIRTVLNSEHNQGRELKGSGRRMYIRMCACIEEWLNCRFMHTQACVSTLLIHSECSLCTIWDESSQLGLSVLLLSSSSFQRDSSGALA